MTQILCQNKERPQHTHGVVNFISSESVETTYIMQLSRSVYHQLLTIVRITNQTSNVFSQQCVTQPSSVIHCAFAIPGATAVTSIFSNTKSNNQYHIETFTMAYFGSAVLEFRTLFFCQFRSMIYVSARSFKLKTFRHTILNSNRPQICAKTSQLILIIFR